MAEDGKDIGIKVQSRETELAKIRLNQALKLLSKYLPQAKPLELTEIIVEPNEEDPESIGGFYWGKLRGKHYLSIKAGENVNLTDDDTESVLGLVHELVHQRHAEIVGQEQFKGADMDKYVTDQQIRENGARDIFLHLHKYSRGEVKGYYFESLEPMITEGIAILAEFYVMRKLIAEARASGDTTKLDSLLRIKEKRLAFIKEERDFDRSNQPSEYQYYEGPYKILGPLLRNKSEDEIPNIISRINLAECGKIRRGTEEYNKILKDPTNIPGLEGLKQAPIRKAA